MEMLKRLEPVALLLMFCGALNWGIVGISDGDTNVISSIFGSGTLLNVVYVIVGVSVARVRAEADGGPSHPRAASAGRLASSDGAASRGGRPATDGEPGRLARLASSLAHSGWAPGLLARPLAIQDSLAFCCLVTLRAWRSIRARSSCPPAATPTSWTSRAACRTLSPRLAPPTGRQRRSSAVRRPQSPRWSSSRAACTI